MESAYSYFEKNIKHIDDAMHSIEKQSFEQLVHDCEITVMGGGKIITSGLGKNVPVCEKFTGTMLSLGLNAGFLHTNSAVHGDMGMVNSGDLVILLTKSGSTAESVYLAELLKKRTGVKLWLLTFTKKSRISTIVDNTLTVELEHEGDLWNIVPNNSTTINLLVLQNIAIELSRRLKFSLEDNFKPNHPGGAIGSYLRHEK